MQKLKAIELLGGSVSAAAKKVGVSYQAVNQWPEILPARIEDRVISALARDASTLPVGQPTQTPPAHLTRLTHTRCAEDRAMLAVMKG
ncbi:hypothetical protein [Polaromonas sp. CG9_12]|nr:hypothetical protein [Polaromonas sp. CG9_12]